MAKINMKFIGDEKRVKAIKISSDILQPLGENYLECVQALEIVATLLDALWERSEETEEAINN